jgi:hypothetical protein
MEDSVIISAIQEQEKGPNHESPLKPIDLLTVKIDKLTLELEAVKRDIKIILDHINYKDKQSQPSKGWWY